MIVSKKKLEQLIGGCLAVYCDNCPIEGEWTVCDKYRQKNEKGEFLKAVKKLYLIGFKSLTSQKPLKREHTL